MKRGDIVVVDFPYSDGSASKIRPALVILNDRENVRLRDTVIATITGNISRVSYPTQVLVDPNTAVGASSSLHGPSSVLCCHLYTIRQSLVISTIGYLSATLMQEVDESLRAALDLKPSGP